MDATNEIGNLTNVHNQMRFIVRVHGAHAIFCCFPGRSERDREIKKRCKRKLTFFWLFMFAVCEKFSRT